MANYSANSKLQSDIPHWPQIRAFFAPKKRDFAAGPGPERYVQDKPRLVDIATIAALLDPKAAGSRNPGPAIQKALRLIDAILYQVPFEHLSTAQRRVRLREGTEGTWARDSLARLWHMDKGPWLTLEQLLSIRGCKYKNIRELRAMLGRVEFPYLTAQYSYITLKAYRRALRLERKRQQDQKSEREQKRRAKQV